MRTAVHLIKTGVYVCARHTDAAVACASRAAAFAQLCTPCRRCAHECHEPLVIRGCARHARQLARLCAAATPYEQLRTTSACSAQLLAWGSSHSSAARAQLLQVCSCTRMGTADTQLCACTQSQLVRARYTRVYASGRAFCGRYWAHVTATASTVWSPACRLILPARVQGRKLD